MSKTHLVFGDTHCHPDYNNDRAILLGKLIVDTNPDVVVDLGDTADMPSLSSYDKGKRSFVGRAYQKDIQAHNEFQEQVWSIVRKTKKKLPYRVRLIGNHEQRIEKTLDLHPELEGTIGFKDLDLNRYYDTIVPYDGSTPGTIELDGITYGHYLVSGVMGRPVGGERPASALISKMHTSITSGHIHTFDFCVRRSGTKFIQGLVAGCFQDYSSPWAGQMNQLWWRGCFIKRDVSEGFYDLECVSLNQLKKCYG